MSRSVGATHKILTSLLHGILAGLRSRATLQLKVIALRHQLSVSQRDQRPQIRLSGLDRIYVRDRQNLFGRYLPNDLRWEMQSNLEDRPFH
jgi:hypothetical protein